MQSAEVLDPRLKRSKHNNKFDTQEVEHQQHYAGSKRRIGRNIDQEAATTYSKELDAKLQAEQECARAQASTGTLFTSELQQALATQQLRGQAAEIKTSLR